jgi:hypothetical protein
VVRRQTSIPVARRKGLHSDRCPLAIASTHGIHVVPANACISGPERNPTDASKPCFAPTARTLV